MPTIAILGASADRAKFGNKAVRAYRQAGYEVFPINLAPYQAAAPTDSHANALRAIRSRLADCQPETMILAAHQMRWFSLFVAAASGAAS